MQKPGFSKLEILVVDPSPHMASLVAQMLRYLKVKRIEEVTDADAALQLLEMQRFSAIVLNDLLDPVGGVEIVRKLRQSAEGLNRDTPVIMMSSTPDAAAIATARDAGVTEFLRKPFAAAHLESRLNSILAAPRPFIEAESYAGPDRRRKKAGYSGAERRTRH